MAKIELTVNGKPVSVEQGTVLVDAAWDAGYVTPTMCYLQDCGRQTSCMVCLVKDTKSGRLVPACSMPAAAGMAIDTESAEVMTARKAALELLLSEHFGDCEGPCRRGCPAKMDIPLMIRQIAEGKMKEAAITVKEHIPFPASLGRVCPAPCEKVCRRAQGDQAVSICLLKRYVGDYDLAQELPHLPVAIRKTGKKVAVVGAGPCGLSAAYYLLRMGHDCTIFEARFAAGGGLRGLEKLPASVLDGECNHVLALGGKFEFNQKVGKDVRAADLLRGFHAVVLAAGAGTVSLAADFGVEVSGGGIKVKQHTHETGRAGVFAGGNALKEAKMAVRAVAHGKTIAASVDQYLAGKDVTGIHEPFDSRMGKLDKDDIAAFMKQATAIPRVKPGADGGFAEPAAVKECGRCFSCDCGKKDACRLRDFSGEYKAVQSRYAGPEKRRYERVIQQGLVAYEPGKCIKCGICVKITEKSGEKLGLTFINRGFDVRIAVPFDEPLKLALAKAASECIEACPTGALSRA